MEGKCKKKARESIGLKVVMPVYEWAVFDIFLRQTYLIGLSHRSMYRV